MAGFGMGFEKKESVQDHPSLTPTFSNLARLPMCDAFVALRM